QCFDTTAVAGERPREHVVAVDRRSVRPRRAGKRERAGEANGVVDVEERRLEIRLDAVGAQETTDRSDQRVLAACSRLLPSRVLQVTERGDELWEREGVRRALFERNRVRQVAARRFDLRKRVEGVDVAGSRGESGPVLTRRG